MEPVLAVHSWWLLPAALFLVCCVIGIIAVPAGIGGGVLFVPIVAGFFPFHLDFVRATGLLVALAGAVSAAPRLVLAGVADLRLALPAAVIASVGSVGGALLGMRLSAETIQVAMGASILGIFMVMAFAPAGAHSPTPKRDRLADALGLSGRFQPMPGMALVDWRARRSLCGLAGFAAIGLVAGLFGLGAGWGNVPVLNLVMGVPIKLAAGTSSVIMGFANSSAAWVFVGAGAVLPLVAVPSIVGVMLGARLGARLLPRMRAGRVRALVLALLLFAGARILAKGLAVWP